MAVTYDRPSKREFMKHAILLICAMTVIGISSGCGVKGKDEAPRNSDAGAANSGWQPTLEAQAKLDISRPILTGKGSIRPPRGFGFEEQVVVSDPVAVFSKDTNRIEILMCNGLSKSVTCEKFAATTKQLHASVSDLKGVKTAQVELGSISGASAARFRYQGTTGGQAIEGVYYIWRPNSSGPIWNLVAEGNPDQLPVLEASVLTFRAK